MEIEEKLERVAEILDQDAAGLSVETRLDELGWDSMGMLSVIALAKQNGKTISGNQIRGFITVADILNAAF